MWIEMPKHAGSRKQRCELKNDIAKERKEIKLDHFCNVK